MATITGYTKAGVDSKAAPLATTAPLAPGVATAGTSGSAARADHVHPRQIVPGPPIGAYARPLGRPLSWGPIERNTKGPMTPYPVYTPHVLKEITFWLATAADAGSFKIAVFEPGANGMPDAAPVWASAPASAVEAGGKGVTPNLSITKTGVWWFAFLAYGHTATRALPNRLNDHSLAHFYSPVSHLGAHQDAGVYCSGLDEVTGNVTAPYADVEAGDGTAWAYMVQTAHPA